MAAKSSITDAKQSSFFLVASIVSAGCNYILYIICARILSPSKYGDLALVLAVSNQILGALFATNLLSIYLVHKKGESYARGVLELIQRRIIIILLILATVMVATGGYFAYLIGIQDRWLIASLYIIVIVTIPAAIWMGYFQAHKEFLRISFYTLASSVGKLILTTVGALFSVRLALVGVMAGQALGLITARFSPGVKPPSLIKSIVEKPSLTVASRLREHRSIFWTAVISVLVLSFAQNADIIIANLRLSDTVAGNYSGISLISNAAYYLGFLLLWLVLPRLVKLARTQQKQMLRLIICGIVTLVLGAALVSWVLGDLLSKIFLGENVNFSALTLPAAITYQLTLITTALIVYYFILQKRLRSAQTIIFFFVLSAVVSATLFGKTTSSIPLSLLGALLLSWSSYGIIKTGKRMFVKNES